MKTSLKMPAIESVKLEVNVRRRYSENSIKNANNEPMRMRCTICQKYAADVNCTVVSIDWNTGKTSKMNANGKSPTIIHGCTRYIISIGFDNAIRIYRLIYKTRYITICRSYVKLTTVLTLHELLWKCPT